VSIVMIEESHIRDHHHRRESRECLQPVDRALRLSEVEPSTCSDLWRPQRCQCVYECCHCVAGRVEVCMLRLDGPRWARSQPHHLAPTPGSCRSGGLICRLEKAWSTGCGGELFPSASEKSRGSCRRNRSVDRATQSSAQYRGANKQSCRSALLTAKRLSRSWSQARPSCSTSPRIIFTHRVVARVLYLRRSRPRFSCCRASYSSLFGLSVFGPRRSRSVTEKPNTLTVLLTYPFIGRTSTVGRIYIQRTAVRDWTSL